MVCCQVIDLLCSCLSLIHIFAEGVETENQIKALNHYACTYQQGFYYAPTMEKDVLMKVLGSTLEESRVTIERCV